MRNDYRHWILKAGKLVYPRAVWDLNPARREVAVTFDDGPEPGTTEKILEILAQYGTPATFFCLGSKAEKQPSLLRLIKEHGHAVGNHSYSHPNGFFTPTNTYVRDVEKAHTILQSPLFRPPYGRIRPAQYKILSRQFRIFFWNAMSYDFHPGFSSKKCLNRCLQYLQNGAVFVFHDTPQACDTLLTFLPEFLENMKKKGLQPVKLDNIPG